jgi:hypothetical protein
MPKFSDELIEYFFERVQWLPKQELRRFTDGGQAAAELVNELLERWKDSHAQYGKHGRLLAKRSRTTSALTNTTKELIELEAWQLCSQPAVVSNLDLICALHSNPNLDNTQLVEKVLNKIFRPQIGESMFWATALCYFSKDASVNALFEAHTNFTDTLYLRMLNNEADLLEKIEPLRAEQLKQAEARKKFIRKANQTKASRLRTETETYRKKYPRRSRNDAAKVLSQIPEIGLRPTRIKELFTDWYSLEEWPNEKAGRKPKPSE